MQKFNADRQQISQKIQGTTAVLFILIGIMLGNVSERYGMAKEQEANALAAALAAKQSTQAEAQPEKSPAEDTAKEETSASSPEKETEEMPKPYEPAPDKLNLAFFYPEDAESEDIIDSYAGQVFQELMVMDLDWLSSLYELADISPSTMASRLGKSRQSIMGGYNPRDKAHKAGNPSSWVIHDWKKIHVNFVDGDGRAINGFSNVKDILSMANVYTYYTDMMDVDTFAEYSRQLWKDSHSYRLSMGDLYYCSGCLNKTEEDLVREAEADELASPSTIPAESLSVNENNTPTPDEVYSKSSESSSESQIQVQGSGSAVEIASIYKASSSNSSEANVQTAEAENEGEEAEENIRKNKTQYACPGHVDLTIHVKILGLNEKNGLYAIDKAAKDKNAKDKADKNATQKKETARSDKKEDLTQKQEWEGWTKENMAHVNKISNEDWFEDYGLRISSFSLSTPLTNQEIDTYMNQLPADTSVTRRNIIHFALSSVGRVPYYWGGKPAASGYEGNNFGALVPADDKGRILRGLDCSGWINWVYWSATGKRLAGESTSSLCLCGERISRSELKPGDIIVRTGTGAHVVMFLSWNVDGRMNVIHESSASVNNVSISTMDAPWPYYRKLVD